MRHIQLQAIVTFGTGKAATHGPTAPPAWVGKSWGEYVDIMVGELNAYWKDRGIAMRAEFDPDHDVAFVSDDAVNDDDATASTATDPNGSKVQPHRYARQARAIRYPGAHRRVPAPLQQGRHRRPGVQRGGRNIVPRQVRQATPAKPPDPLSAGQPVSERLVRANETLFRNFASRFLEKKNEKK